MHSAPLLLQTPALEGVLCFTGQETRAWHEASFKREHRKPSCQIFTWDAAHFPPRQLNGKAQREMEQRQWEELHWSCSVLCDCHGPCLLLPGPSFVLHPQLETDHSNYLLLPRQRGEKESRDGRRKAVILMGLAFKFICWEKMARTLIMFQQFAWWVFNT